MHNSIIENRATELDNLLKERFAERSQRIDNRTDNKKDILIKRFLNWEDINDERIEDELFLKIVLSHLEKISQLNSSYQIETHRQSIIGKVIVWVKRMILKVMLKLDVSLKYQNQYNLALTAVMQKFIERVESIEVKIHKQQVVIDDLLKSEVKGKLKTS